MSGHDIALSKKFDNLTQRNTSTWKSSKLNPTSGNNAFRNIICLNNQIMNAQNYFNDETNSSTSNSNRTNVPVMGKNALLLKTFRNNKESTIVQEIVKEKFSNILNNYYSRCVNRNKCYDKQLNFKSIDENRNMKISTDYVIDGSTFDESSTIVNTQNEKEYVIKKFLNNAVGDELNSTHFSKQFWSEPTQLSNGNVNLIEICDTAPSASNSKNSRYNAIVEAYEDKLKLEINNQNQITNQILKAIRFCEVTKKFMYSDELLEAEKVLLISDLKKQAILFKLNTINMSTFHEDCQYFGTIGIKDIQLPVEINNIYNGTNENYIDYYLLILRCGVTVLASEISAIKGNFLTFHKSFIFSYLSSQFKIALNLYCIQIKRNKTNKTTRCLSPKDLFSKNRNKFNNYVLNEALHLPRPSSFMLWGQCDIRIADINRNQELHLYNTPVSSKLNSTVFLTMKSSVEITTYLKGFITIAIKNFDYPIWNRRWCVLDGSKLKYWNYPNEECVKDAIDTIDLRNCPDRVISTANRCICSKPNTLWLPIRYENSTKNYMLSMDSFAELLGWKKQLNAILDILKLWKCGNFRK